MRRRHGLAAFSSAFVLLGLACVDLFHSTDFETLCTQSASDPACGGDGGSAPDVTADVVAKADASRPHPDFCAWSSTEARTQALRACAWLGACEGPLGASAFGSCVVRAQLAFDCVANPSLRPSGGVDTFWACLASVRSCGDVDGCVFPGGVQECVAVPTGSSTACGTLAANATARLKCAGPAGRAVGVEPCIMLGRRCAAESGSVATCSGPLGFDTCTVTQCAGTKAVDCNPAGARTLDRGVDCAGYGGGDCVTGDAGPSCSAGSSTFACTGENGPACDGNVVASCASGKGIRIDCNRLGLPCDVSTPVAAYDPAAACVRRSAGACVDGDKCVTATQLQSCARGALYEVNCASVGLGNCKVDATTGLGACARPPL